MTETVTTRGPTSDAPSGDIPAARPAPGGTPSAGRPAPCPRDGTAASPAAPPPFDLLVDRYRHEIHRFAIHLTGNVPDADDLYQETMFKAYRAYGRLPGDANHRAWLYRIASNAFLDDRRRHARVLPLDPVAERRIPDRAADPVDGLDARDLLREVWAFIAVLPPKQRVALVLRKHHELSYDEIATTLSCSTVAARANVHEALRKLRDAFGDRL